MIINVLESISDAFKNCAVLMQPGHTEKVNTTVEKSILLTGWSGQMTNTQTMPSVRVTIWVSQGLNYTYTKKNSNPEDEKKWWIKHTTLLARWAEPWVVIPQKNNNTQFVIRKKDISIMEFKWEKGDDDD